MLERIDMERVSAEAREVRIGRGLLTVLTAIFYVIGWTLGKTTLVVGMAISWSIAAAKVGWQDARQSAQPRVRRAV